MHINITLLIYKKNTTLHVPIMSGDKLAYETISLYTIGFKRFLKINVSNLFGGIIKITK